VRDPPGQAPCSSVEGSSPRWAKPAKKEGDSTFVKGGFSAVVVIMALTCVLVEEPLCPDSKGLESGTRELSY
jgi:hypothetical protein